MLNWLPHSSPASRWNPFKTSSKTVLPSPVLSPARKTKALWSFALHGSKRQTWPQWFLSWSQKLLSWLGTGWIFALFLLPLLTLFGFALFMKFVRKRPLRSLSPFNLRKFRLFNLSLPFGKLPHFKLGGSLNGHLPNGNLPGKLPHGKLFGNLPNGHLLGSHLPKGHFLSDRVPNPPRLGFLRLPRLPWYLRWLSPTALLKKTLSTLVFRVFNLHKVPGLRSFISWIMRPRGFIPKGTLATFSSLRSIRPGLLSRLNPFHLKIFHKKEIANREDDEKFQAGEPYGDAEVVSTKLVDDLRAVGFTAATKDLQTLIEVFKSKGKPQDDRQMAMEKMIAITASLPRTSATRKKLSSIIIDKLYSSLQHPPLTYMGERYQYRTPDGSYNNPMNPDLGKAGSPYARSVQRLKTMHANPPDPGLLFDLLMARTDDSFKENPAGINSVLFYHATIIIHDIFRTNRFDPNISDTSSYLDLAPLYGSSLEDQRKVRMMERGLLKPDTFHERRLIGQPPGVNVMLVMYNRFHNYVADVLLKINEGGRFTLPPTETEEEEKAALEKQDNDLFQTARLVVGGLYANISLHDYLRGITNTHHSKTDWTLDPRVAANRLFDPDGIPRGVGNQVSAEFNLLYRFHSIISRRDETWLEEFLTSLFPDSDKPLDELTPEEFVRGLFRFEQSIPADPSKREFGNLKRGKDGRFADADLARVMQEAMEDPAGLFGPRMVPKFLKIVEVTGILTARKWQLASLNELRDFFKLKRHASFEDVNPDPAIADLLRKLYDHPDMVEMYPGMFLEDAKPRMDPGSGACPPYTVGRAVLSDAVTLVRSDRFYTLDYTTASLTNWGFNEVKADYDVLGGSKFYTLIQRALPGWFPYNSLHVMQPMFTPKMNEQIARELGTIDDYTRALPAPPRKPVVVRKHSTIVKLLNDQTNFRVPWVALEDLFPGKKSFKSYMLGGDSPVNTAQKKLVKEILYTPAQFGQLLSETAVAHGRKLLKRQCLGLKNDLQQIDIIRDVAIPLNTRLMADLWCQDLQTDENPTGTLTTAQLYKYLMNARTFGFYNSDPAMTWRRRIWARQAAEVLIPATIKAVKEGTTSQGVFSRLGNVVKSGLRHVPIVRRLVPRSQDGSGSLRWYGNQVAQEMMAAGKTLEDVADICWLTALGGVGAPVSSFADVMSYLLKPENARHWEQIQELAISQDREAADKMLRQYVLEAQRMNSNLRGARVCAGGTKIDGTTFNLGDFVVYLSSDACREAEAVPDPDEFKLDRPANAYIHWGAGPHECLGREVAITIVTSLVKVCAELKNLRPAPGQMGNLKSVNIGTERCYLNDSWSWLTVDPTTWKVHFEGYGKGVYRASSMAAAAGTDLNALANSLRKQNRKGPQGVTPEHHKQPLMADGIDGGPMPVRNGVSPTAKAPSLQPQPLRSNGNTNGSVKAPNDSNRPAQTTDGWSFDNAVPNDAVKPPEAPVIDGKGAEPDGVPENEAKPVEPDLLLKDSFIRKADDRNGAGLGSFTEHVTFKKPYNVPPKIFLGLAALDLDCTSGSPSFCQEAQNITHEGFDLVVSVEESKLWELESVWIQVPNDERHRDVLVGTWDSAKLPGKPAGSAAVESPFFPYMNFGSGDGPVKAGRRAVIPWISGFVLDTGADEPFGVKVEGRSTTNGGGDPGVVTSFRKPSADVPNLPKSVRTSILAFLPGDAAVGLSRASAKAEFPNQDTDSVTVLAVHSCPISPVAGVDMFQYLEGTEAIRLRVTDRQKEPDEAKYSLESWDEPLVHDLSASIVKIPKRE